MIIETTNFKIEGPYIIRTTGTSRVWGTVQYSTHSGFGYRPIAIPTDSGNINMETALHDVAALDEIKELLKKLSEAVLK